MLNFIVSENNAISGDEENDDWLFDECDHCIVKLLKKKNYSVNTTKKYPIFSSCGTIG